MSESIFIECRGKCRVEVRNVGGVSVLLRLVTLDARDEGAVLLGYDALGELIGVLEEMRKKL